MNARLRLLLAAGAVAAYSVLPVLRPLYPLLSNPAACAQRAESLAQLLIRAHVFTLVSRRS